MTEKRLVVTRADSNCAQLIEVTHPAIKCYATRWHADFKVLDHKEDWMTGSGMCRYRILKVYDLLDDYDRILIIDSDVIILPECPDPFETVDPDKIGSIYEDVGSRQVPRRNVMKTIQEKFGKVDWREGYINTGVFIVSKKHRNIFSRINGQLWHGTGIDDVLIGYNIHKYGFNVQELDCKWNFMPMHGESWNGSPSRFNSYITHYSGAALFEDDQSGRLKGTDDLDSRMRLIIHDTNRIAEGLAGFTVIDPTPKQGLGSITYNALIGVQEKEIIVKHHHTPDGLERECKVFDGLGIPYIVDCYGVSQGADGNRYMMLQKLRDLPGVIDKQLMLKIATRSLIALRQLWKHDIPWICKLDHIMLNDAGEPKLIDFDDEPYPKIPFYGHGGEKAIIMDSECDATGRYLNKDITPRSGWLPIMKYLCEKNGLPFDILYDAEYAMVEYEYQNLENVHQPIYFDQYKDILKRESDVNDPNYGKLVEANQTCVDRARMLHDSLDLDKHSCTWLDIGCNVGWFCFYFKDFYVTEMTGIDFDINKIEFATMMAEGEKHSVKFEHAEINLEYVQNMPSYDIISALSTLHLKLVEDKDVMAFQALLTGICEKVNNIFFFEYPPHAYGILEIDSTRQFINYVKDSWGFKQVTQIGVSGSNQAILKCVKS